jgi:polyphosphate kinase
MKKYKKTIDEDALMNRTNKDNNKNISFKEYFDNRFTELKNYMDIKFESIEKSTCLAQENLNTRLESMNEFRNSLKDQTAQYITRVEHDVLKTQISVLEQNNARSEGKASMSSVYLGYIVAFIGIILGVIGIIIKLG